MQLDKQKFYFPKRQSKLIDGKHNGSSEKCNTTKNTVKLVSFLKTKFIENSAAITSTR